MSGADRFTVKGPLESVVLEFDFTKALDVGEVLIEPIQMEISVDYGTDPLPTNVYNGPPEISDTQKTVLQPVRGGIPPADYFFRCTVFTNNPYKVLTVAGILPVRDLR